MLEFEVALAMAEAELGFIPTDAAHAIAKAALTFQPDLAAVAAGVARDGMVVPDWVKQLREAVGAPHDVHMRERAELTLRRLGLDHDERILALSRDVLAHVPLRRPPPDGNAQGVTMLDPHPLDRVWF